MRRFLRYLRIISTVFCGIACVLLIALWVRSYSFSDATQHGSIVSMAGKLYFHQEFAYTQQPGELLPANWIPRKFFGLHTLVGPPGMQIVPHGVGLAVSYWWLAWPTSLLVMLPWIPWSTRFALRTLLVGTTLIAVVLGLIVWMSHSS